MKFSGFHSYIHKTHCKTNLKPNKPARILSSYNTVYHACYEHYQASNNMKIFAGYSEHTDLLYLHENFTEDYS